MFDEESPCSLVAFTYPFKGMFALNVDYDGKEYRVCWTGDWKKMPSLDQFPKVEDERLVEITPIPHSGPVDALWASSRVLKYGYDAHIRILPSDSDNSLYADADAFPICKVSLDQRQRASIQDEFALLRHMASLDLPIVRIHNEPLTDEEGIFGFRMEKLFNADWKTRPGYDQELAHAIELLHQSGIVHGDPTPSNVMQDKEGRLVLIDFGRSGKIGDPVPPLKRRREETEFSIEMDQRFLKWITNLRAQPNNPLPL